MADGKRRCFRNAGQVYYGDVEEAEDGSCTRHGLGLQIITAETVTADSVVWGRYQGAWKQGSMTGSGVYRWSDGSVYEGHFLDGRLHGHGRLTWPEGSIYDGSWLEGEMHGQGTFTCGFDRLESHGIFRRNCLKQHDGTWLDLMKLRKAKRLAQLEIGAVPQSEVQMPVSRCTPDELQACMSNVLRQPPYLIPLILASESCLGHEPSSGSAAPLCFLEADKLGCTAATTVHLAFAAAEKHRKRDYAPHFRTAIREALLTSRTLALVFGDEGGPGNPQDEEDVKAAPEEWSLAHFFHRLTLPQGRLDSEASETQP
ncbi:unnamed protein product, partial [Polarella glacialis]